MSFKVTDNQYGRLSSWQLGFLYFIVVDLSTFLLLARYVLNVAKRSIEDQCNIEDRPTTDLCSWKSLPERTSNGHISI